MNWFSNLWKGLGSVAQGAGKAVSGAFNPLGAISGLGSNIGQNIFSAFMPKQSQGKSPSGGVNLPIMGARSAQQMGPAMIPSGISTGDIGAAPAKSPGKKGGVADWFSPENLFKGGNPGQAMLGLGANLAGQAFSPKVNMPDMGSLESVQNLRNFQGATLPRNVEDSINRSVDIQHEQEMRRLRDVYKNARPGTDYLTDSAYQRDLANLQRQQTLNRADAQANALGQFNQQEMQHLSEVAQMDIYSIMVKLGMDAQEAEQFKQTFSNIGTPLLQSGLGLDQFNLGSLLGSAR